MMAWRVHDRIDANPPIGPALSENAVVTPDMPRRSVARSSSFGATMRTGKSEVSPIDPTRINLSPHPCAGPARIIDVTTSKIISGLAEQGAYLLRPLDDQDRLEGGMGVFGIERLQDEAA
jgi:hypothetical protein